MFKDKSVILTSLKNTPYYESCKDSSEDICVTYKSNVTERGIPKELCLVHANAREKGTSQFCIRGQLTVSFFGY